MVQFVYQPRDHMWVYVYGNRKDWICRRRVNVMRLSSVPSVAICIQGRNRVSNIEFFSFVVTAKRSVSDNGIYRR